MPRSDQIQIVCLDTFTFPVDVTVIIFSSISKRIPTEWQKSTYRKRRPRYLEQESRICLTGGVGARAGRPPPAGVAARPQKQTVQVDDGAGIHHQTAVGSRLDRARRHVVHDRGRTLLCGTDTWLNDTLTAQFAAAPTANTVRDARYVCVKELDSDTIHI